MSGWLYAAVGSIVTLVVLTALQWWIVGVRLPEPRLLSVFLDFREPGPEGREDWGVLALAYGKPPIRCLSKWLRMKYVIRNATNDGPPHQSTVGGMEFVGYMDFDTNLGYRMIDGALPWASRHIYVPPKDVTVVISYVLVVRHPRKWFDGKSKYLSRTSESEGAYYLRSYSEWAESPFVVLRLRHADAILKAPETDR